MSAICQAYARHWVISRKYFTKIVEVVRLGGAVQSVKELRLRLSEDDCGIEMGLVFGDRLPVKKWLHLWCSVECV